MKTHVLYDRRFLLLNPSHLGPAGAFPQQAVELRQRLRRAHGVDLDPAVLQVLGIAAETQLLGRILDEIAIAYALHAPPHKIPPGGELGLPLRLRHGNLIVAIWTQADVCTIQ